ncbi:hypothetical protein GL263_11070 [Streptomyces durbertensis]|uniref:Uncharacterized protein n=1 Tax=Streptomyces durbertensis TaxID=2448886 RepID=A0ABR6EGK3_9ACTN|nr:hypothetical protein [Streptomyces durbertensis]MBB1244095.1 hypothetical protein [Streptomyces durbertensis]
MLPDAHLFLHHTRADELRSEARACRRADRRTTAGGGGLRVRFGWTLVAVGLRLATGPRAVATVR